MKKVEMKLRKSIASTNTLQQNLQTEIARVMVKE